jgi:PAS domain S-box-containing protein
MSTVPAANFLQGGTQAEALIRDFDWAGTPLGPIAGWPQSLKTAVALVVRSTVPMVLLWGDEGYVIYNDGYARFAGARHPALLGSKVREGWPEVAAFNDHVMRVCLGGGNLSYKDQELVLQRRSAPEPVWMNLDYSPVTGESGTPAGVLAVVVETTDRVLADRERSRSEQQLRQANAALHASELRFRSIAEAMPGFIFTATGAGFLQYISPSWASYTGSPGEASQGHNWLQFIHPQDVEPFLQTWRQGQRSAEPFDIEFRLRDAQGEYHWWLTRTAVAARGEDGSVELWVGACTELSEIVEARLTLQRSHEDLEREIARRTRERDRVWSNSRDIMAVMSFDGVFRAVSPAWLRILGYRADEVEGRHLREFVHPENLHAALATLAQGEDIDAHAPYINRYWHKDGSLRWISWFVSVESGLIYLFGRDITAEREAAAALAMSEERLRQAQKMEAVGQLTGGLAHDFNNLLTGITGSLEIMQARIAQGRVAELGRYIEVAQSAARRAAALTQRLLAFSRQQTLSPRPTDANRLIRGMEELIRRTVGPAIELEVVDAVGLWATLIDPSQLENALLNLCINARDAMPGGGRLTIETANKWIDEHNGERLELAPGQYISVCVTDTGTGMTPEVKARAFDPFFTTKPLGQGTGLGLSMIYGFARQSGGQVRIYSELGKGTTMCLYLPRDYRAPADQGQADIPPGGRPAAEGRTVVIVDDDESIRLLLGEILTEEGYTILAAADGPAGLRILQSDAKIDLLITDVGLPGGMNGRQIAEAARALRPGLKVLFITGYAENAVIGNGHLDPGMQVLTKPFPIETLFRRVRDILDK